MVNIPISKSQPATLSNFKLCDDTSITTTWHPSSCILLNICCNSILSGVVFSLSAIFVSFTYEATVPINPTFIPCFNNISLIIYVVVVFPFVPVTPTNFIFFDGFL